MQDGLRATRAHLEAGDLGDEPPSVTDFLDTDRALLGTQDRSSGNDAQQCHGEQNAYHVRSGRIPLKPFHPLIIPQP
jgi:hypothetical protein